MYELAMDDDSIIVCNTIDLDGYENNEQSKA